VDYPVVLPTQLKQYLKSLRKSRKVTQTELAQRLGVVQSRVADIEANPGAISVEQLLQILAVLNAQLVVQDASAVSTASPSSPGEAGVELQGHSKTTATASGTLGTTPAPSASSVDDEPKGQW
jgi:HTH-type transcriptional regulator/antitoxin HipB